jgi:hypothetical protein
MYPSACTSSQEHLTTEEKVVKPPDLSPDHTVTSVKREPPKPMTYQVLAPPWISDQGQWAWSYFDVNKRSIHGVYKLPPGYDLMVVPDHFQISPYTATAASAFPVNIATSGSPVTVAVGLYQIIYGAITLYWARADQVALYGYSSFSLAVIPYILMTAFNLTAQLFTEGYPSMYMIENDIMREAIRRKGVFQGMIGVLRTDEEEESSYYPFHMPGEQMCMQTVHPKTDDTHENMLTARGIDGKEMRIQLRSNDIDYPQKDPALKTSSEDPVLYIPCCSLARMRPGLLGNLDRNYNRGYRLLNFRHAAYLSAEKHSIIMHISILWAPLVCCCVVLLVIYGLCRFAPGSASTAVQRAFIMSWIILGALNGLITYFFVDFFESLSPFFTVNGRWVFCWFNVRSTAILCIFVAGYIAPALGGMVVAGLQIKAYGDCQRL